MSEDNDALAAAYMAGRYDGRKQAEANVARLTKERDWLAGRCAVHCRDKWPGSVECNVDDCTIGPCIRASSDKWIEAARRSVAAGEE